MNSLSSVGIMRNKRLGNRVPTVGIMAVNMRNSMQKNRVPTVGIMAVNMRNSMQKNRRPTVGIMAVNMRNSMQKNSMAALLYTLLASLPDKKMLMLVQNIVF